MPIRYEELNRLEQQARKSFSSLLDLTKATSSKRDLFL